MKRREFLAGAAATPLVFGLADLLAQDVQDPKWWTSAKDRMKGTHRCGLVLVGPAEEKERADMGEALLALVRGKDPDVRALLAEAVVVCLRGELADRLVRKPGESENLIALDPDGRRLAAATLTLEQLRKPAEFVAQVRKSLHGSDGARLRASAERARAALGDSDRKALAVAIDALDTEGDVPAEAVACVRRAADVIAPWLALASLTAVYAPGRERCRQPLLDLWQASKEDQPGPKLPYGVRPSVGNAEVEEFDCKGCGMAESSRSRAFLEFLTE